MPRESNVVKQQRIGERLSRDGQGPHGSPRARRTDGLQEAQILLWEHGRAPLYPTELIKLCHALDVLPEWLLCWERRLY
jgi:hypothetical protein